jgi:hypothetical protein
MKNMATMMFNQRFGLYFNSMDRNTIAIGNIIIAAIAANTSLVIGTMRVPLIISSSIPGSMYRITSPWRPVSIRATHSTESFIFTSSMIDAPSDVATL